MDRRFLMAAAVAVFYLLAPSAHALETGNVEPQTLKDYAVTLNKHAGNFQWQQLWKATRDAHYLSNTSDSYFTVPMKQMPDYASRVLSHATSVMPYAATRATYRYDFGKQVGVVNKVTVTAVCVDVDWRTLPAGTKVQDATKMGAVSLLLAKPCS